MSTPTREELLTEWVAALRSGKYQQGREYLHNRETNTYCCLGVVCDILTQHGILSTKDSESTGYQDGTYSRINVTTFVGVDNANDQLLPQDACRALGLVEIQVDELEDGHASYERFDEDPEFLTEVVGSPSLSSLNDTYGFTFIQIADLIEDQLLGGAK